MILFKLLICSKLSNTNITLRLEMPKYAVAVGRQIGIYDTYEECKSQVLNYPNAKYKKFELLKDAEDFILKLSRGKCYKASDSSDSMVQVAAENVNKPNLIKLEKVPQGNVTLKSINERLNAIEERLNKFISETTSKFESFASTLALLEGPKRLALQDQVDEPLHKKVKIELPEAKEVENCGEDKFIRNKNDFVVVYTDGACTNNGKMGAKAGIGIWFNHDHPLNISAPVKGPPTNNTAEIQAATVALTQARKANISKLSVHTDSQFLINCITQWIHKWKKNDWKLSTGGTVKNKDALIKLDNALQMFKQVEWNYVPGHRGVEGNEMADRLATRGAQKYKTNLTYGINFDDSGCST